MDLREEGKNYYFKANKAYTEDDVLINNIFLYNLPKKILKREIENYFKRFGEIQKLNLIMDNKPKARRTALSNTGFICFKDPIAAANVLQKSPHFIRSKRISVKAGDTWHQPAATQIVASVSENNEDAVASSENNGAVNIAKTILALNDDCLEIICKNLAFRDQVHFAQTCKRFLGVFKLCSKLQYKVFDTQNMTSLTLWEIRKFFQEAGSSIETITGKLPYKNCMRIFEIIGQFCPSVTRLHLDSTTAKTNCLRKLLERLTNITELTLIDCGLTNNAVATLHKLPLLKSLTLSKNYEITGKHLHKLTTVEELTLYACGRVQSTYLEDIFNSMKELKKLDIRRCERLDYPFYNDMMIKHCVKLENLKISTIINLTYENVARLPNLVHLHLVSSSSECAIRPQVFYALVDHKSEKLQYLQIQNKHCITLHRAEQIANLKQLKHLICPNNEKLDDNCLRHFSELENLEELVIRNCASITNAGLLTLLRGCKHLQQLNIQMCPKITDAFIFDAIKILSDPSHKKYRKQPLLCFAYNTAIHSYIVNDSQYIGGGDIFKISMDLPFEACINDEHGNFFLDNDHFGRRRRFQYSSFNSF